MSAEFTFSFPLASGLHARPAAALRLAALALEARFELHNLRSQGRAELGDLLALLATDTHGGDPCRIRVEGPDPAKAAAQLQAYLDGPFRACDETTPTDRTHTGTVVPALLNQAATRHWQGLAVAPGVAIGPARLLRPAPRVVPASTGLELGPDQLQALEQALDRLRAQVQSEAAASVEPLQRAVLEAHAGMLGDRSWIAAMEQELRRSGCSAAAAVQIASAGFGQRLHSSSSAYLQERALDLEDLTERLLSELLGPTSDALEPLTENAILVANRLTPSRFLALDRSRILGLVLAEGGRSHTAILARSFGLPCVAGLSPALVPGQLTLVDGERGLVIAEPPATVLAYYRVPAGKAPAPAAAPGGTGPALTLRANILSAQEAVPARQAGADGIGLFRTEMLFMDRPQPPDQAEQERAYRQALAANPGQPLVLRLLDVGGDKPLPYLPLAGEANPFLGCRGVRVYPRQPDLIRTQLRAALAAAEAGELRLMVPMVSELEELQAVRGLLEQCRTELAAQGRPVPNPALGIMVEVPAALLNLDALASAADFFCVGSNDLVQYLFAADRGDATVAKPEHDWHPATLRALATVVQAGQRLNRPVSLCGEMAGRPQLLPLLVGLGFTELSMAPPLLEPVRAALAGLDLAACQSQAARALAAGTSAEVTVLLQEGVRSLAPVPLLSPDLVLLDRDCQSKAEAIKVLVEGLAGQGRTLEPQRLEEAIWAREQVYATGVGFGFAVPHAKCAGIQPTLAVLSLRQGLDWGALDGQPVDFVVLLAMAADAGDEHLRVFARLARKLMNTAFRDALRAATSPAAVIAHLQADLF